MTSVARYLGRCLAWSPLWPVVAIAGVVLHENRKDAAARAAVKYPSPDAPSLPGYASGDAPTPVGSSGGEPTGTSSAAAGDINPAAADAWPPVLRMRAGWISGNDLTELTLGGVDLLRRTGVVAVDVHLGGANDITTATIEFEVVPDIELPAEVTVVAPDNRGAVDPDDASRSTS